jgi:hypothetical protein
VQTPVFAPVLTNPINSQIARRPSADGYRDLEEPIVQLATGMEGRWSGSARQSGLTGGICSARRRGRSIRAEPGNANDGRFGMPTEHRPGLGGAPAVIEIDLPGGVRVRVDSGINEKALRRVLSALRGLG